MNGRDWRQTTLNLVPTLLWLVTLAGLVTGVIALVAVTIEAGRV